MAITGQDKAPVGVLLNGFTREGSRASPELFMGQVLIVGFSEN